jgi:hypothetical protein
VTAAQLAIDSAMQECERLHKNLRKGSQQVKSDDEKQIIKATVHAWYNNHRNSVAAVLTNDHLKPLDDEYRSLLVATGKATLRTKYVSSLKRIKTIFSQLQADNAIQLSSHSSHVQQPTSDLPPQFSPLISDSRMQGILARRWQECVACIGAGAPLAATVMMGGILEGLLLARINQLSDKGPVFKAVAPKDKHGNPLKLNEWGLKNYIDVAHELGWISRTTKDIGEVVRDYRNFIHPQKEHSHAITISTDDARMMWEVAKSVTRQILKP